MDDDPKYMGTPAAAKIGLLETARVWRAFRQPIMSNAKALRQRDALEHQAQFKLANAALLWLWHEEHPAPQEQEKVEQP